MARRLGEEALDAHAHGRFAEAFERFETAEKIAHSPVLVLWMARSKRALGELLVARDLYRKVAAEELGPDASPKWTSAVDEAKHELPALERRIPHLRVTLVDAPRDTALSVDGRPRTPNEDIEIDPGDHAVTAKPARGPAQTRSVHVVEGEKPKTLTLHFGGRGSLAPGGVTLGLGLAALAAGAATGSAALALAAQVKDHCVGNQCLRSDQSKADTADRLARASTGLLIGGGVVSAIGVTLLVARPGSSTPAAALELGPGRATFGATF
jgi:hypothetical protein